MKWIHVDDAKACPFCGHRRIVLDKVLRDGHEPGSDGDYAYYCRCTGCACCGPWYKTEGNAIRWWNMRCEPDARPMPGDGDTKDAPMERGDSETSHN